MAEKTARLTFDEDPDNPIRLRLSVALGDYLDFVEQWDACETVADLRAAYTRFSQLALLDGESMLTRGLGASKAIVAQWLVAVRDVPPPLLVESTVTALFPEDSTPPPANRSDRRRNSSGRSRKMRSSSGIPATP